MPISVPFDLIATTARPSLAVTGNYYAAYPEKIAAEQRARDTFLNVVMPILKSEVPRFQTIHRSRLCP